jgi:hypothetical protein
MDPFGPGCPWYDSLQACGPANLKWCEERVCGWINEPANAWSNVAYFAAAGWIAARASKTGSKPGVGFAACVFIMGAFSFLYHASNNFLTQALDFFGMFLTVFLIIATNAVRAGWARRDKALIAYSAACVLGTAALWPLHWSGVMIQYTVAVAAVVILVTELLARKKEPAPGSMGMFWTAAAVMVVAECFSLSDASRLWCDPTNHVLQGHAVWHTVGGLGMALTYLYMAPKLDAVWGKPTSAPRSAVPSNA